MTIPLLKLNWIPIGAGRLTLWHRLGQQDRAALPATGCHRVVTLLSESEHGERMGRAMHYLQLQWTWIPLKNGRRPVGDAHDRLLAALPVLSRYLDDGESILIHCSAGIHRTGMLAYALLRWRGYAAAEALDLIGQMRQHTRDGLQPRQIAWGEAVIAARSNSQL